MSHPIQVKPKHRPELDPGFVPPALWNRAYREAVANSREGEDLGLGLQREDGSVSIFRTVVFPHQGERAAVNELYLERLMQCLLWQRGGFRVLVGGSPAVFEFLRHTYSPEGRTDFDRLSILEQIHDRPLRFELTRMEDLVERESGRRLGGHLNGCRIGFDLGGSDRKSAAVRDGEVLHTEEVVWDPYFNPDPDWHYEEINDSLKRAAAHLPRVDAIGGSSAGVYVDNEIRVASLFRGVSRELFRRKVRPLFKRLRKAWGDVPLVVANDGDVTALAGAMSLEDKPVLGLAMGTSLAAGYVDPQGSITGRLNELAFAPVDYRPDAPRDEWSGDRGVGAQYFSQQAVGRLISAAGIEMDEKLPLPEKLVEVQQRMEGGDEAAGRIYDTIGVYLGYTLAHYADFYRLRHVLVLGRVMSGPGGARILKWAERVLGDEFPGLASALTLHTPDEKQKRLGQAVAAASLPRLKT